MLTASTHKTLIMGVMNATPDSFFDGGLLPDVDAATARAMALVRDGADVLDIGGESSRPGASPVEAAEEQRRVLPVIERAVKVGVPISVDTYHAKTARAALALGATVVNDITALRGDPDMGGVVAKARCSVILMHMRGTPQTMQEDARYNDVVDDIRAFFEERVNFATHQGIKQEAIWLDPGFGFGKTPDQNLELLRRLAELKTLGLPILIGTSNKSTIGRVLDLSVHERTEGTAATVALSIANGADAVRVHDVKFMARVATMADAILGRRRYE